MEYTKGKWEIDKDYWWIRANGKPIIGCWGDEREANAHLIAAAPELYEFVKEMAEQNVPGASSLIAKAEGGK